MARRNFEKKKFSQIILRRSCGTYKNGTRISGQRVIKFDLFTCISKNYKYTAGPFLFLVGEAKKYFKPW